MAKTPDTQCVRLLYQWRSVDGAASEY
eukprot:COSAG01_NODE_28702_length_655_cov_0.401079_1_plen_26_part_10